MLIFEHLNRHCQKVYNKFYVAPILPSDFGGIATDDRNIDNEFRDATNDNDSDDNDNNDGDTRAHGPKPSKGSTSRVSSGGKQKRRPSHRTGSQNILNFLISSRGSTDKVRGGSDRNSSVDGNHDGDGASRGSAVGRLGGGQRVKMEGHLSCQESTQRPTWTRCYFVLFTTGNLYYYKSKQKFKSKPLKPSNVRPIEMKHYSVISDVLLTEGALPVFELKLRFSDPIETGRSWVLRCDTEDERDLWNAALSSFTFANIATTATATAYAGGAVAGGASGEGGADADGVYKL